MKFLIGFSLLFIFFVPTFGYKTKDLNYGNSLSRAFFNVGTSEGIRKKRSPNVVSECIFVTSEDSEYIFKHSPESEKVCGIYIVTDPNKRIAITFNYFNVPCEDGGQVSVVDGWELQGEFFPGNNDKTKTLQEKYKEFCGVNMFFPTFTTSQNAGMLHYKLPTQRSTFSLSVEFIEASKPCDILVESINGIYTLRNFGEQKSCTLMAIFPAKIRILTINIGEKPRLDIPANLNCSKWGDGDYVQIGGADSLDSSKMVSFKEFCGVNFRPGFGEMTIGCEITVVRLHSSGKFDNFISFTVSRLEQEDLMENTIDSIFVC